MKTSFFKSHATETHFYKKGFGRSFVRVFGTRKWPICPRSLQSLFLYWALVVLNKICISRKTWLIGGWGYNHVFSNVCLHSRSFPLRADWRKFDSSDDGPQENWRWNRSCKLSFPFLPRRQSAQESLLAG